MSGHYGSLYLDYNASAPLCLGVVEVLGRGALPMGNASSVHTHGRNVRKEIEGVRKRLSEYLCAPMHDIYFTSGATESNNIVIKSFNSIVTSSIEHDSILKCTQDAVRIPVSSDGIVSVDCLQDELRKICSNASKVLVSIMIANNETGVVQPIAKISDICLSFGALLHVDYSQGLSRVPINLMETAIDYMSISGHKFGALSGVGALLVRKGSPIWPLQLGGGQEMGVRPGTQNVMGILSLGAALSEINNINWDAAALLRDYMEAQIQSLCPDVIIAGKKAQRLANTSCISMPGVDNEAQVIAFDIDGFSISAGSACSSGKVKESHVLRAMGFPSAIANQFIRVSLCPDITRNDIDRFIESWYAIYQRQLNNSAKKGVSI